MAIHLLSFLNDVEQALLADDPAPDEGTWENNRTVNYHLRMARVTLNVRLPNGQLKPRGAILLQNYHLADGAHCLKAALSWAGSDAGGVHAIYAKPSVNWKSEARRVSAIWQAGPPTGMAETPADTLTPMAATG